MNDDPRIGDASEHDEDEGAAYGPLRAEAERLRRASQRGTRTLAVVGTIGFVAGGLAFCVHGAGLLSRDRKVFRAAPPVAMAQAATLPVETAPAEARAALTGPARAGGAAAVPPPPATDGPRVQVALLLDTSSSMEGLIDQARSQMWRVVNELALARRQGQRPQLELALYEYGNALLADDGNYIRQVLPFTTDFDRVSEQLFALSTNGGQEFCGAVIQSATRGLAWSDRPGDVRLMLIAGNESFAQGPVPPAAAIAEARRRGIVVNPILCEIGPDPSWRAGAVLAGGHFVKIDQNRAVAHVEAPQDAEIAHLGTLLNQTYVPYGALGSDGQARQIAQDSNAGSAKQGATVERSLCKSGSSYRNDAWDLVDALAGHAVDLARLADADLPPAMRGLDAAGRAAYVERKARERSETQARIARLSVERAAFIATERRRRATAGGPSTLDMALIRVARAEAERKRFRFVGEAAGPHAAM